jgi:pyruvate ferredoxin oxidoreductase gamma subunit
LLQEVRWHGRGGQGAWTASLLLARAALFEEKNVQSFPEFGPERRGAPVKAYTRISDEPIDIHCNVYEPNVVVVIDPTLLKVVDVTEGLHEDGSVVINSQDAPEELRKIIKLEGRKIWSVPASIIAREILGRDIPNTAMIAAAVRASDIVKIKGVEKAIETFEYFTPKIVEMNLKVIEKAYSEAKTE